MAEAYDQIIAHSPQTRSADGKVFLSSGGMPHAGKRCRKLRQLTHDDPKFAAEWDVQISKAVVELEDGSHVVVLHDEVRG